MTTNRADRRKGIEPKQISLQQDDLIKISFLQSELSLPFVIEPALNGVSLPEWANSNANFIETNLLKYGGILFRNFNLNTEQDFQQFLSSISLNLMRYTEGATPRTELADKIYTSTEYPADQTIMLHNELTYVTTWPLKICFLCMTAPEAGGQTPIADVRKVYNRIAPKLRERFREKGWMLVRNYGDGLSLPWQTTFHTTSRAEVEKYCASVSIDFEWKGDNGLRTWQVRPALARHPQTREMVWFNHIVFWHVSSLTPEVREIMLASFCPEDLPYNTYYGDGSTIEDSVIAELNEAYREETVTFAWQKSDLLLLSNMLVAHGRNAYVGSRRVLAAMGDACSDRGL